LPVLGHRQQSANTGGRRPTESPTSTIGQSNSEEKRIGRANNPRTILLTRRLGLSPAICIAPNAYTIDAVKDKNKAQIYPANKSKLAVQDQPAENRRAVRGAART
jgi:hypothetical protein